MEEKIRVLIVDDSALVRKIVADALESDPSIEVIGTANNGKTAVFKTHTLNPDVITMDIEMPIMNGLDALRQIIETNPKPVIMMSVLTQHGADATFRALELGAVDFIPKPSTLMSMSVEDIKELLISKVKSVYRSKVKVSRESTSPASEETRVPGATGVMGARPSPIVTSTDIRPLEIPMVASTKKIVGIGTSTGGPSALISIFKGFPHNFPAPVLIVQHMPEGFTRAFAERLDSVSTLNVKEAEDGDKVLPGCGYLAPGHSHMTIERHSSGDVVRVFKKEKVSGHMPSIDVLFSSIAEQCTPEAVAVIMTGMGRDGADGILKIRKNGGYTFAQNEETSVVYGMNRVAVEIGGTFEEVPLLEISKKIVEHL
ncbi:MAG TPA: chemotaxis response regulator protein-glutamate methylesterase [Spirochaetota bacterium]|nr:chemotaxis response regulator protein-glutamate methylesterase [Spirochaetota bacterium]